MKGKYLRGTHGCVNMNKKHLASLKKNPWLLLVGLLSTKAFAWFPDKLFLKIVYWCRTGFKLDLENPRRFNEKLQWLKLYDRKPEYVVYVDKYAVREYVKEKIGAQYLIPILGVWDSVNEINFDELPSKYVLKCTHDSGSTIVVDKETDINRVKKQLSYYLSQDYYLRGREWPYRGVKRRIICEHFLKNNDGSGIVDYKFMCSNGKAEFIMVCTERNLMGLKVDFFDLKWNRLPFERHYPSSGKVLKKPDNLDLMIILSEKLSQDIPFVRVDLYEINGRVYFGELTLYPGCGFEEFKPDEWDEKIGKLINLPK